MTDSIRVPADFEPHERTIMAWAVHREWGGDRERVERELETVIRAIAEDEPVTLLTPPDLVGAARLRGFGPEVELVPAPVDDVWMRDIAPVFAKRGGDTVAIDFNFNGWDGSRGARPGDRLARTHDFGVPVLGMPFVGEGGAFVTDGAGLAVTTRSCLLSRNPHLEEEAITRAFGRIGMHTVIWLDGDHREPITTGHPDGYMAFLPDRSLLVEAADRGYGRRTRDREVGALREAVEEGRLRSLRLFGRPRESCFEFASAQFAGTYMNLFVTRRSVLTALFGDEIEDPRADRQLRELFPGREVRVLDINAILRGGGGIRCLTQPVPYLEH
ncbi:agmatine deiminase family protein [Bradyrhizobium sp. Leaf401]|uniref:agmatine deiminase family protein n=1 Tax=Bradyrhizobium sp. Leaf401 TaxID=2876564 RepID=UPI001E4320C2|nr:agmatine deiminase family protein [Bradyrhizobium sp. Leaf401]